MEERSSKNWLRWLIWAMLAVVIIFFLARGYLRLTDNFNLSHMTYDMPHNPDWEVPPLTAQEKNEVDSILNQSYNYVGKGAQSYVFASEDGKYVIKFFKFRHLRPSWIIDALPEWNFLKEYREKVRERKNRLIMVVFSGYKLAYDELRSESGIVYLHLNKSQHLDRKLTVYDKLGLKWEIDLDDIVFVIQEKAKTTRSVLQEALKKNNLALVKTRISQIFDLYMLEYSMGIYDIDHGVLHNTGFVGDKAIHLDVGRLTKDDKMKLRQYYKPDLIQIAGKFEIWFRRDHEKVYPEMKVFLEEKISKILGEPFKFE
jgi:hypothetical protein